MYLVEQPIFLYHVLYYSVIHMMLETLYNAYVYVSVRDCDKQWYHIPNTSCWPPAHGAQQPRSFYPSLALPRTGFDVAKDKNPDRAHSKVKVIASFDIT